MVYGFDVDYSKFDDQTLLRLIARSQEGALGELYDRYSRLVYSLAINAVGDAAMAEEITQDVYVRIWEKADTYRAEQGKVVTWIASITRYRAIDLIRRQQVRPEGNQTAWVEDSSYDLTDLAGIEDQVELSERREQVRKAIAQLPEKQRQALAYAYFQGYSHREIAEVLNEPVGTIKTRIRLGMQKLRNILYEENQPSG